MRPTSTLLTLFAVGSTFLSLARPSFAQQSTAPPPTYLAASDQQTNTQTQRLPICYGEDPVVYKGGDVPAGCHIESRPRNGLIVGGGALMVAGSLFIFAAARGSGDQTQSTAPAAEVIGGFGALLAVHGAAMVIIGYAVPRDFLVPGGAPAQSARRQAPFVSVAPTLAPTSAGLSLQGAF